MKFREGDRVRVVAEHDTSVPHGFTGTELEITGVCPGEAFPYETILGINFSGDELELIPE